MLTINILFTKSTFLPLKTIQMKEESSHCLTCLCCLLGSDHIDINRHREGFGRRDSTYTGRQSHALSSTWHPFSHHTRHECIFERLCCWIQMGLNYITCTSIKKHEHFHSHLIFMKFYPSNTFRFNQWVQMR